jgi:Sigma-70, region 4
VNDRRVSELRAIVRAGEVPPDLLAELQEVARRLAASRRLPPSFAPYGVWNEEAADEAFGSWCTEKLLGRGQLQALLDRSDSVGSLRSLAARSLRHHLVSVHDRSQAQNLYRRIVELLEDPDRFRLVGEARRPGDRFYGLPGAPADLPPWQGDDRALAALAWSLGDFAVIRYGAGSRKLSPVLDAGELQRFVSGLLEGSGATLSPNAIVRAIAIRFDLGDPEAVPTEEIEHAGSVPDGLEDGVLLRDTARSILDELSSRQQQVLKLTGSLSIAEMAAELGCSVGTIANEQRRAGDLFRRLSEDDDERDRLLKIAVDLLYVADDG